ncbi:hypothetical protein PH562_30475 [Rhizobium sp. CNPSo 4062]|uniref:hypothetical protein n=1 Tax=Rhizobium sp. CNPSo 4062 TaxID=3021410 RepID=UPI000DDDEE67|nr:hypothetical protein [Rhizobium sp. CNPSo 4062]MDK4706601.1 hypothetical protein [Rhizobium sp. CNPSo 4062]
MTTNLKDLKLRPSLLTELNQLGYETAEDMSSISSAELLRIPGMGGHDWRKISRAIGRELTTNRKPKSKSG